MDPMTEFADAVISPTHWVTVAITLGLVAVTVGFHYEVLSQLNRRMPHWRQSRRVRILTMMFFIVFAHVVEIWLWGVVIYLTLHLPGSGLLTGTDGLSVLDAIYFSATTFSTLGFGDLVPTGPIRFIVGTESLLGLVLITWSASFTYLEMQQYWKS